MTHINCFGSWVVIKLKSSCADDRHIGTCWSCVDLDEKILSYVSTQYNTPEKLSVYTTIKKSFGYR